MTTCSVLEGNNVDLDARELAARQRENATKKKRARPKARDQIRRGRKVARQIWLGPQFWFLPSQL